MNTDIIVAFACAAVSAAALAYLLVRGLLGSAAAGRQRSGSSVRTVLAPVALFFEARRGRDIELNRTLDRFEKLVVQSGGDLLSAIRAVIDVMDSGPVRDELSRVVAEVTIGTSLAAALNNVAARVGTNEANAVFSTLAQSLEMGTSVAENLQSAAQLIRHSARVRAQAQAQKAVVNMSFPLLLLILPGVFIVLFAPLVIQYVNR